MAEVLKQNQLKYELKPVSTAKRTYGPCNEYWIEFDGDLMIFRLECFFTEIEDIPSEETIIDQVDEIPASSITSICKYLYTGQPGFERWIIELFIKEEGSWPIAFKEVDKAYADEVWNAIREWWHANRKK